jgi:hypothetical protein
MKAGTSYSIQEEGWINGQIAVLSFDRMLLDYPTLKLASETQQARKDSGAPDPRPHNPSTAIALLGS